MLFNVIQLQTKGGKHKEMAMTLISISEKIRQRKGCMSHHVYQDLENENVLSIVEKWESENDLKDFMKSDLGTVLKGSMALLVESFREQFNIVYSFDSIEDT